MILRSTYSTISANISQIPCNIYYRPQTKFGARKYFHKRVSFLLSTGGGGGVLASQHASQVTWPGVSTSGEILPQGVGGLPPGGGGGVCLRAGSVSGGSASGGLHSRGGQSASNGVGSPPYRILRDTDNKRTVRILECILVEDFFVNLIEFLNNMIYLLDVRIQENPNETLCNIFLLVNLGNNRCDLSID